MAKVAAVLVALALVVVAATSAGGAAAQAQQCDAGQLAVCAPAIIGGAAPTGACCSSLHAQEGCLCQYARDPAYSRYINSPAARSTLAACGITIPRC